MKRYLLLSLLLLTIAATARAATAQVRLESRLYVFNQERLRTVKAEGVDVASDAFAMISPGTIRFDDATLTVAHGTYTWSSGAAPRLMTMAEIPNMVAPLDKLASFTGVMPTQYFEKAPSGFFALKQMPDEDAPRWKITFRVGSAHEPSGFPVSVDVEWATITRREKIPGVDLDVGKPVVKRANNHVDFAAAAGDWSALFFSAPNGGDYGALLLVRVTPVTGTANGRGKSPNAKPPNAKESGNSQNPSLGGS